jgi:hypothetical protein
MVVVVIVHGRRRDRNTGRCPSGLTASRPGTPGDGRLRERHVRGGPDLVVVFIVMMVLDRVDRELWLVRRQREWCGTMTSFPA